MNELVQLIMQKTGLSQDKAQEVVDTVVTHLKARLPESLTSHFNVLLGDSGNAGNLAGYADKAKAAIAGVEGMFAKKSE